MNIKQLQIFIISLLGVILISCSENTVINQSKSITESWNQGEKIQFEFEITDTLSSYNFFLNIRNSTKYRFSNIYFFIDTKMPDGNQHRDTIECILADREGKWIGKGMGDIKENSILIRNQLLFPMTGNYSIDFEQAMRIEALKGIKDIGIKLVKNPD